MKKINRKKQKAVAPSEENKIEKKIVLMSSELMMRHKKQKPK
jgi:hypothetical protein